MMDDAAFYACNSMVSDRFLLTTAFNLVFTRPLKAGPVIAEGRWVSGKRRVFVGEARLILPDGEEAARGTGTFMRSHIPLSSLDGYRPALMQPRLASSVLVVGAAPPRPGRRRIRRGARQGRSDRRRDRGDSRRKGQKSVLSRAPAPAGRQLCLAEFAARR